MRIGIDSRLPTYQMGGISQYVLHLLPALAELDTGHEYVIYHSRKESRSFVPDDDSFSRSNLWTPCHHRWERWGIAAEIARDKLAVFHSPDFIPPEGGANHLVITVHDLTFLYYPDFLTRESRRYYNDQIEWAVRTADHISADSEATRQDLLTLLSVPPEKVTTIHLAANPLYLQPPDLVAVRSTIETLGLTPGFVLAVGTLEPRKNLGTLVQAMAILRQEREIERPLVLAGRKGWHYEALFELIEALGLDEAVIHVQGLRDTQLQHLYAAAGVLATPSYYEGFGLPPLEAMHVGCPVLVSDRGSLPEIVGVDGWKLDPDDVVGWANALEAVLTDDDLRKTMVTAGRRQAQTFRWEKTAAATQAIYEQVAGVVR